jgi:hypothetical protein
VKKGIQILENESKRTSLIDEEISLPKNTFLDGDYIHAKFDNIDEI